jgi:hypothetical protein
MNNSVADFLRAGLNRTAALSLVVWLTAAPLSFAQQDRESARPARGAAKGPLPDPALPDPPVSVMVNLASIKSTCAG